MFSKVNWRERQCDESLLAGLRASGRSEVLSRLLANRGVGAEELEEFFDPSLLRLARSESLPGVDEAVKVILPFVADRRKIVVFGDYDADGVCASAILVKALRRLGGDAEAFIPLRFGEGYGLTAASIERMFAENPEVALVVTVDNGISSPAEVASIRARGVTVVVTDHHLPGIELPQAEALVNPKVASAPGCDDLCGAGVAFFLACALTHAASASGLYKGGKFGGPLLVLAGLATVADLMPLCGQNRVLVAQALAHFHQLAPIGVQELYLRSARNANQLLARDFAFTLAPRINAAGRMDSARLAYDLIMADDREQARGIVVQMEGLNGSRKGEEVRMDQEARAQLGDVNGLEAVVVSDAGLATPWHSGVAGIVASRLLEFANVPAAVVVGDTGSVRAPCGYNVHDALAEVERHLVRFGGHAAAGGFTLKPGAYDEFKRDFAIACAAQKGLCADVGSKDFDGWLHPGDATLELSEELKMLEPVGEGNPMPVFGFDSVTLADVRPLGAEGKHLVCSFVSNPRLKAVWWGHGMDVEGLRAASAQKFDVFFTLVSSDFGGELKVELQIKDIRPTPQTHEPRKEIRR